MITDKNLLLNLYLLLLAFVSSHVLIVFLRNHHSEFNLGNPINCNLWIATTYAFLIVYSYLNEKIIISGSKNHSYFKDITLEFQNLPLNFSEKDFKEECNQILDSAVVEVSFIYNLNEYFESKNRLEELLEQKNKQELSSET